MIFSLNELETSISERKNGKSLGLDGLPAKQYKAFWCLIKFNFPDMITEVLGNSCLSISQNNGVLSLLYKNGEI